MEGFILLLFVGLMLFFVLSLLLLKTFVVDADLLISFLLLFYKYFMNSLFIVSSQPVGLLILKLMVFFIFIFFSHLEIRVIKLLLLLMILVFAFLIKHVKSYTMHSPSGIYLFSCNA